MTSQAQIEANRRNSLKSTGPKTPAGKAAVRLNALRNGLWAKTVVLPGEKQEDFDKVCDDLEAHWQPQNIAEQAHVEEMADCYFKKIRFQRAENSILSQDSLGKNQIPLAERIWKQQARNQRCFIKAQHELQRLQEERRRQPAEAPAAEKSPSAPAPQPAANGHATKWITSPPPDRRQGSTEALRR